MRQDRPSATAATVAVWRGCGPWLPEGAALCEDPFALAFAPDEWAWLVRTANAHPKAAGRLLMASPLRRLVLWIQIRTHIIDDVLRDFAGEGGRQVVLLGAGFDARAARFQQEIADGRVFEVDHPATQVRKRSILAGRGLPGGNARYMPWDFERDGMDSLPAHLVAEGLDPERPTLTIWEGVVMYLTEALAGATVDCVRQLGGPGSRLVFNYTESAMLQRLRLLSRLTALSGEPVRFGFDPAELPGWLAQHGFRLRWDELDAELAARLLPAHMARGCSWAGGRIALAEPTPG
jgi:methyltransferase (TIGR00027 family)